MEGAIFLFYEITNCIKLNKYYNSMVFFFVSPGKPSN